MYTAQGLTERKKCTWYLCRSLETTSALQQAGMLLKRRWKIVYWNLAGESDREEGNLDSITDKGANDHIFTTDEVKG